jgi:predicted dienelactone hydrolase
MNSDNKIFVGSKEMQVSDKDLGVSFPVLVQYPTQEISKPVSFGPYLMDVAVNAKISENTFPLVIISHGNGGSHLLYHTLSTCLAQHGYIVAMLEHYGNNRNNNSLENTVENLMYRPKHLSLTIDALLAHPELGKHIDNKNIAVIGHSMGGYTALALAGGIPHTKEGQRVQVAPDARVKALVLLAPGTGWFMYSLSRVSIPILMLTAEHDPITPAWNADIVINGVPDKSLVTHHVIKNAGHFSFLSPFPAVLKNPGFLPSTDPPGFDREEFHTKLPKEILDFLSEKLNGK